MARTRQPHGVTKPNRAFVGERDLLFNAATPYVNLANGKPLSPTFYSTTTPYSPTEDGIGYCPNDNFLGSALYVQSPFSISGAVGATVAFTLVGPLYDNHQFLTHYDGGQGFGIRFNATYDVGGNAQLGFRVTYYGVTDYDLSYSGPRPLQGPVRVVITVKTGRLAVFVNGSLAVEQSVGTLYGTSVAATIEAGTVNITNYFRGRYTVIAALSRAVTDDLASELSRNQWQLFAPQRRLWVQLGAAASGDTSLIIPDISQTQSLDSLLLTTQSAIVVQDTAQTHALENIVLSTAASTNLIVNDTSQTHTVDAPLLTSASLLGLADTSQSHTLDNTILTSNTGVVVADTSQVHTLDNLDLDSGLILTIDGINHTHSVEATGALVTTSVLQIADVAHGQQTDSIDLNAQWFITVNDSNHSHTVEVPTLTLPGTGTGATVDEIADEIMLRLNATTIPVDVQKINSVEVFGTGTNIDPWR